MKDTEIKRGQPVTFRIPSDTPDHILKYLQQLKEKEKRNFSSKVAEFVMNGVNGSLSEQRETLTIPLPKRLSKAQRDWLKHEHSEAVLSSIVYQLLCDPVRTASLFASLNSNALEIDDALYLQEDVLFSKDSEIEQDSIRTWPQKSEDKKRTGVHYGNKDDDLDNFDWEKAKKVEVPYLEVEEEEEDAEDLLGDFLAQMNK
jgi:hypothetical protein